MPGGYQFNGNPEDLFREFFGGAGGGGLADLFAQAAMNGGGAGSPFVFSFGGPGGGFARAGAGGPRRRAAPGPAPVDLTLEELYRGATKSVRTRAGGSYDIEVKPGWKAGTKISFGEDAFVVRERPHARFTRAGNDLTHWCEVDLGALLTGSRQTIQTLDGRRLAVEFPPLTVRKVRARARELPPAPRRPAAPTCRALPRPLARAQARHARARMHANRRPRHRPRARRRWCGEKACPSPGRPGKRAT